MSKNSSSNRIVIAEVIGAHGVRGTVKIKCHAEDPSLIEHEDGLFLSDKPEDMTRKHFALKSCHKGDVWLGSMEGIETPEQIKKMGRTRLYIEREDLPEIEDADEEGFYYSDLEGLRVMDHKNPSQEIGVIASVRNYGASDLLLIRKKSGEEFHQLFTDEHCPVVNIEEGFVEIIEMEIV